MRVTIAILVVASSARAQAWAHAGPGDRVSIDLPVDAAITAAGFAGFVLPELLKRQLAPARCNWCDPTLDGPDAWFHDELTGSILSRKAADTTSSVLAMGVAPAFALGAAVIATGPHASYGAGARAAVLVLEASAVSQAAVESVKFLFARQRPFARYAHGESSGTYDLGDPDSHMSFPSAHTAIVTSLGVSAAMTATLEESRAAPWLWGAAAVLSVTAASLRMIAEKHYFTDVMTGAAIGAASGVLVPWLHRQNAPSQVGVAAGVNVLLIAGAM